MLNAMSHIGSVLWPMVSQEILYLDLSVNNQADEWEREQKAAFQQGYITLT